MPRLASWRWRVIFLENAFIKRRHAERKAIVDLGHVLPMSFQAQLVNIG